MMRIQKFFLMAIGGKKSMKGPEVMRERTRFAF